MESMWRGRVSDPCIDNAIVFTSCFHLYQPNQDKLTPLEAELTYHLVETQYSRRGVLTPVLNMDDDTPLVRRDSLYIKNNCGGDNICKPNLNMKIFS